MASIGFLVFISIIGFGFIAHVLGYTPLILRYTVKYVWVIIRKFHDITTKLLIICSKDWFISLLGFGAVVVLLYYISGASIILN